MATKIALSSFYITTKIHLPKLPSSSASHLSHYYYYSPRTCNTKFRVYAELEGDDAEAKQGGKRKFITKEEEPEQYWQTAGEKEGENPMSTPLPYILIFGMSTPFIILAIAFANGWIKAPIR